LAQENVEFPITGKITSVNVKVGGKVAEGQVVEAGDLVAIIEY
jgi:biotin carboxyl carrier protein